MLEPVKAAFECQIAVLPISAILPMRKISDEIKLSKKFKMIAQSICEIGIIEPIVVARSKNQLDCYLLLDGHLRLSAIIDQGVQEVRCLIADDDEAFTYNKRINGLATIQEHYMIVRALERGVSGERLAKILNVEIKQIQRKRTLLDGICSEVVEMLKDKKMSGETFEILRKMKPIRQVEVTELMNMAANYTVPYAKALLAATRQGDLVRSDIPKKVKGLTVEQMDRMEREMASLQQDFKAVEASYGDDVLNLVIASGYLAKLVNNSEIERYLSEHHPEILSQFRSIVSAASIDQPSAIG